MLAGTVPAADRARLLAELQTFTDARVERYRQLLAVPHDRPAFPASVPAFEWLIAALRAAQRAWKRPQRLKAPESTWKHLASSRRPRAMHWP